MRVEQHSGFKITKYIGDPNSPDVDLAEFVGHDSTNQQFQPDGMPMDEDDYNRAVAHDVGKHLQDHGLNVWVYERSATGWRGWSSMKDHLNGAHTHGHKVSLHAMLHFDDVGNSGVSGTKCMYWHNSRSGKRAAHLFAQQIGAALRLPFVGWDGKGGASLDGTDERGVWHLVRWPLMPSIIIEHGCASTLLDARHLVIHREDLPAAYLRAITEYQHPF